MVRHVPTPPGWVPEAGLIFPPPGVIPRFIWWVAGGIMAADLLTSLIVDAAMAHPGPWPEIAGATVCALGGIAFMAYFIRRELRARRLHPEDFPPAVRPAPALPAGGMRLVAVMLVGCLCAAALAAGAIAGSGHPRLAGAVAVGIVVLAIPGFGVAAWWSLRPRGRPRR